MAAASANMCGQAPDSFQFAEMKIRSYNTLKVSLMAKKKLKKLVLVINDVSTKEVLERWEFGIENAEHNDDGEPSTKGKDEKRIRQEMSDVLRQITASVAFLPLLEARCSFDVLIHTYRDAELPEGWADSSECRIENAEHVQLRSFSTSLQTVTTQVQYRPDAF